MQIGEYINEHTSKKEAAEQQNWLREVLAKVTKRLGFTLFMVDNEEEVGIIFEVMNDRGKPLTDLERMKNYLLYVASTLGFANPLTREVNEAWSQIFGQLMAAGLTRPGGRGPTPQGALASALQPGEEGLGRGQGHPREVRRSKVQGQEKGFVGGIETIHAHSANFSPTLLRRK